MVGAHVPGLLAPGIAVHHGQIGVTDSAGEDINLDLIRPQCPGITGEWFETPPGLLDGAGLNHGKAP